MLLVISFLSVLKYSLFVSNWINLHSPFIGTLDSISVVEDSSNAYMFWEDEISFFLDFTKDSFFINYYDLFKIS